MPRRVRAVHLLSQMSPTAMQRKSMRMMNVDRVMVDIDREARADYEARHFSEDD